jgi:serine/threonine-protein kinase RsbW
METGWPIEILIEADKESVLIRFRDFAPAFEFKTPTGKPDLKEMVKVGKARGLGIYMIHKLVDEVAYRRDGDVNELTLIKKAPKE